MPAAVFDYIDGAADGEVTARANQAAFDEVLLRPRMGVSSARRDLSTTVLKQDVSLPVLLAPCGFVGIAHRDGEIGAARAAAAAGTVFVMSTLSMQPLEQITAIAPDRTWLQLYTVGGRAAAEHLVARAQQSGVRVLMVTVDTAIAGNRERDVRNGLPLLLSRTALRAPAGHLLQFARRPRWAWGQLSTRRGFALPNVVGPDGRSLRLSQVGPELSRSTVVWEDLAWLRQSWKGPLVVKGVLTAEDAHRAVDEGADGIVVSNHGGRQLDRVPSTLKALPEVLAAVDGRAEVLLDGGIRRGADVVTARCLGACAVLVGRAYAYGLAANGQAGVTHTLELLRSGIDRTLALLGCAAVDDLGPHHLWEQPP